MTEPKIEAARTKLETAIQEFLTATGDDRVLRDWAVSYSSVRLVELDDDITNYGYVFRNHQPIHHSLGLLQITHDEANAIEWHPGE